MSGVPIPLNSRVAVPDGGKFAGMRMIVVSIPRSSSTSQNGRPRRSSSTRPAERGNCQRPIVRVRPPASVFVVDRKGVMVFGSRWMKSKMPWPPGSSPVMKVDHATGLCGGIVVASGANVPVEARRANAGMRPAAIICRVSS